MRFTRKWGEISNAYSGRRVDDPMGEWVVERIINGMRESGFAIVPAKPLEEVLRISDRSHDAWDAVKAAMDSEQWMAKNLPTSLAPKTPCESDPQR